MPDGTVRHVAADAAVNRARDGIRPGSLRFLAALFSGSTQRPLLEAVYAFEDEVRRIVASASHEAAHARLQWWRGELDRLAAGRPEHPLAWALLPLRGRRDVDLGLLHEMLVAADLDLTRMTYASWQELEAYLLRSAGTTQTLIAATLAGDQGLALEEREFARRLGATVRQTEMLFDLERDRVCGRLYAPLQTLESAGIDPTVFHGNSSDPAAAAFIADWQARVRLGLESLPDILREPSLRSRQRHGLVLAALHARWLDRLPASTTPAGKRPELPALFRLWTAWRTAVRYG
jgi:phytoene synthase